MAPRLVISRPQPVQTHDPPQASACSPTAPPLTAASSKPPIPWPPPNATRPLSDIREITEPSLMDMTSRLVSANARHQEKQRLSRAGSVEHQRSQYGGGESQRSQYGSVKRNGPPRGGGGSTKRSQSTAVRRAAPSADDGFDSPYEAVSSSSYSSTPDRSSCYAVPQSRVPRRSSSFGRSGAPVQAHARKVSLRAAPPAVPEFSIRNRGQGRSPVKDARLRLDSVTAGAVRKVPSQTRIRCPHPVDILDSPSYKHPRMKLELQVSAPLSVGGGTVEGHVKVTIDDNQRLKQNRTLGVGAISVDLLGYEAVTGGRKASFLALGTELVDGQHPPPASMVEPVNPLTPGDRFWTTSPSTSALPFLISLPLDTGPPPFSSKHASICFLLCATALIRDGGNHYRVRTAQEVHILPTYDPEKALTSLSSPLTATDELVLSKTGGFERIKLTAGLHRQVWVSGSAIYVDVHIVNKTHKHVKKLDLTLERDILCYKHAAAATRSAGQARIFESNHKIVIATASLRAGTNGWAGVEPHASETRTCDLELPRGHATVRCGKYFEVRYFLTVTTSLSNAKPVSIQLPIVLVHMNSLDAVPNSVAQVAAAIEEKRGKEYQNHRRKSSDAAKWKHGPARQRSKSSPARSKDLHRQRSYVQGRAFAAPRQQSLDRQRAERNDIDILRHALDTSPRKLKHQLQGLTLKKMGSTVSFASVGTDSPFRAMGFHTPPSRDVLAAPGNGAAEGIDSIRARMRRMASFDTVRSKRVEPRPSYENGRPHIVHTVPLRPSEDSRLQPGHSSERSEIAPHVMGLSRLPLRPSFEAVGLDGGAQRPATAQGFRERIDQTRFEFKGVRRKPSGRGAKWWDNLRQKGKEKEREGWI